MHKGLPDPKVLDEALLKYPEDDDCSKEELGKKKLVKNALTALKDAKKEDVAEFNKLYTTMTKKVDGYFEAVKALDTEIIKVAKEVEKDDKSTDELKAAAKYAAAPATERAALAEEYKAYKSMEDAATDEDKAQYAEYQQNGGSGADDDKKSGGSAAGIIIGVLAGVGVVGGVGYCKCAKKGCFAEKDGLENEGGERTDKSLFKKEVKSKSAHKRHAKESLVPSFKVEEEA